MIFGYFKGDGSHSDSSKALRLSTLWSGAFTSRFLDGDTDLALVEQLGSGILFYPGEHDWFNLSAYL